MTFSNLGRLRTATASIASASVLATVLVASGCSATVSDGAATPASRPADPTTSAGSSTPSPSAIPSATPLATSSTTPSVAPLATAQETLSRHLRTGEDQRVVKVAGGYSAVVFDDVGHLRFFASTDGTTWRQTATQRYVYVADDAAGQHLTVTGKVLENQTQPTFILHGIFTGDGSGNAMAYTYGPGGWGPVVRTGPPEKADGAELDVGTRLPSVESGSQVSYRDLWFSHGYLVESGCDASVTTAQCGKPGTTYTAWWLWDRAGKGFRSAQ